MKRTRTHLPATLAALEALGSQIAAGRRDLGWTAAQLAERLGTAPALVTRIEKGAPGTAIGTVLEAAVLCRVPLFGTDTDGLADVSTRLRGRLALLPERVRTNLPELDNDF